MRVNLVILALTALAVIGATLLLDNRTTAPEIAVAGESETAREALPDLAFTDIKGATRTFTGLQGKVVIVNFWTSWCAPCIVEMPQLLDIARNNPDGVVLILISADFEKSAAIGFFDTRKLAVPANAVIVWDEGKRISKDAFGTVRYPETILVDRNGIMRHKIAGAIDWTAPGIRSDIEALLAD